MPAIPLVGLMIGTHETYSRAIISGVLAFLRENHHPWQVHVPWPEVPGDPLHKLQSWNGDGVIALASNERLVQRLKAWDKPVVNASGVYANVGLPQVVPDNVAVGRLAAEHFLERGFRHYGYVGIHIDVKKAAFSRERCMGYYLALRARGFRVSTVHGLEIQSWLQRQPLPLAVFAANDVRARHVIYACQALGLRVPEDVAVVGVDNDEFQCEMVPVPLSSVDPAARDVGHAAAAMMDQMLRGRKPASLVVRVPPAGLVRRHSSDVLAVDDADVAAALRYIQNHAVEPISVRSVLQNVPVSRRRLERQFQAILGRTPYAEIRRVRLERARSMLTRTDLAMAEVAARCGFGNQKIFAMVFRRMEGMTPSAYRNGFRK